MVYKNSLKTKKLSLKQLNFSSFKNGLNNKLDDQLLPINVSKNTYNFSFKNGALTHGLGLDDVTMAYSPFDVSRIKTLKTPAGVSILGVWPFRYYLEGFEQYDYGLLLYGSDKKLYYNILNTSEGGFLELYHFSLEEIPNVLYYKLNGEDVLLFSNKTDGMFVWNMGMTDPIKIEDAPNMTSMCMHFERLFATVDGQKNEVWFSDDLDPTNWTVSLSEAGFIQMIDERGNLNKVISLNNYLYVFRDFGISRISAFADQTEFSVTQLHLSGSKIFDKTVCACGDNIFYLAQDGIYIFDGINARKLNLSFESLIEATTNACAGYHAGKYYLALRMNFDDGKVIGNEQYDVTSTKINNALLEIDVATGEVEILRGVNITAMTTLNHNIYSNLVVCYKHANVSYLGHLTKEGKVKQVFTHKHWQSPVSDLGFPTKDKVIKEVHVINKEPFELTIVSEKERKTFNVAKTSSVSKIKPNMTGRTFSFEFHTKAQKAHISTPQIIFGVL